MISDTNPNAAAAGDSEVQHWQVEQIKKSLQQADEGKLLTHSKVKQLARKWQSS